MRAAGLLLTMAMVMAMAMVGAGGAQAQRPGQAPKQNPSEAPGQVFVNDRPPFTLTVPPGFTPNPRYRYTRLASGKAIEGVAFTIPKSMTDGTNLAADSYVSVEWRDGQRCTLADFLDGATEEASLAENGVRWIVGASGDGAAGNLYEETIHLRGCDAVRSFVHSTNIANYPPGTIRAYDRVTLDNLYGSVRRSLKWGRR